MGRNNSNLSAGGQTPLLWSFGTSLADFNNLQALKIQSSVRHSTDSDHFTVTESIEHPAWDTLVAVWLNQLRRRLPFLRGAKPPLSRLCKDTVLAKAPWCGWSQRQIAKTLFDSQTPQNSLRRRLEINSKRRLGDGSRPYGSTAEGSTKGNQTESRQPTLSRDQFSIHGIRWGLLATEIDDVGYLKGGGYLLYPREFSDPTTDDVEGPDVEFRARRVINSPVQLAMQRNEFAEGRELTQVCVMGPIPPYFQTGELLQRHVISNLNYPRIHFVTNEDGHEHYAEAMSIPPSDSSGGESSSVTVQARRPPQRAKDSDDHLVFAEKLKMANALLGVAKKLNWPQLSRVLLLKDQQRWSNVGGGWRPIFTRSCAACVRWALFSGCRAAILADEIESGITVNFALMTHTDIVFHAPLYFVQNPSSLQLEKNCGEFFPFMRGGTRFNDEIILGCKAWIAANQTLLTWSRGSDLRSDSTLNCDIMFGHWRLVKQALLRDEHIRTTIKDSFRTDFARFVRQYLKPIFQISSEVEGAPRLMLGTFPFPASTLVSGEQRALKRNVLFNVTCFSYTFFRGTNFTAKESEGTRMSGDLGYATFSEAPFEACFDGWEGYSPYGAVPLCGPPASSLPSPTCFPFCNYWRAPLLAGWCAMPVGWPLPILSDEQLRSPLSSFSLPPRGVEGLWIPAFFAWTPDSGDAEAAGGPSSPNTTVSVYKPAEVPISV